MGFPLHGRIAATIVAVGLAARLRAAAAEPEVLPLARVIDVAVHQSPDLIRARIDVDAARAQLVVALGVEDSHVGAAGTWRASANSARDPSGAFSQYSAAVQLFGRTALSTGGSVGVSVESARLHTTGVGLDKDGNLTPVNAGSYSSSASVQLAQPLLRGAGADAFEAAIRQAERQRDAAALTAEARARDLVVSIAQAYWGVAFGWRTLEVRKASLELAQQQLATTEAAIRSEKVARSEALAVQAAIAIRKQDVINGEQDLYERSLALRRLAGLEIGPDALLVKTEPLPGKLELGELDVAEVVRQAFAHSAELAALEAERRSFEQAQTAADSAARARLDLSLTGTLIGVDTAPGDAVARMFDHAGYNINASLTYDRTVERRAERGGQSVARAGLLAARTAERDAQAKLAVRATRAVQRAQAAQAKLALGAEAIDLAEQNVAAERKRFELGKSTNFDVLRRLDELEQARLRHAEAIADSLSARIELEGLRGTILSRFAIVMP